MEFALILYLKVVVIKISSIHGKEYQENYIERYSQSTARSHQSQKALNLKRITHIYIYIIHSYTYAHLEPFQW